VAAALLDAALAGDEAPIPATDPPCTITAASEGRCMIATVWGPDRDSQRVPLATIGIAAHSRCGARLWEMMHHQAVSPLKTRPGDRPEAPWCAVRLEPGITLYRDAAHWLGDFERILAWVWLARLDQREEARHVDH